MKLNARVEGLSVAIILVTVAITALLYSRLPDPMPTHWNMAGEPDDYSSRLFGAWLMPATMAGIYLLLLILPRLDPRGANVARFAGSYALLRVGILLLFAFIQVTVLYTVISGRDQLVSALVPVAAGIFFLLVGNYMPRMRPNWFIGVRTPWTLSSDQVWRETHRLGGRLFFGAGLLLIASPLLPAAWAAPLIIALVVLIAVALTAYSFWRYRQLASVPDS